MSWGGICVAGTGLLWLFHLRAVPKKIGHLGLPTWLTILRGGLAVSALAWGLHGTADQGPAILFGASFLLDGIDGWIARRSGRVTALGAELDGRMDAISLLAATTLGVFRAQIPGYMLAGGLAYYVYWGLAYPLFIRGNGVHTSPGAPHWGRIIAGTTMTWTVAALLLPNSVLSMGAPVVVAFWLGSFVGSFLTAASKFPRVTHLIRGTFKSVLPDLGKALVLAEVGWAVGSPESLRANWILLLLASLGIGTRPLAWFALVITATLHPWTDLSALGIVGCTVLAIVGPGAQRLWAPLEARISGSEEPRRPKVGLLLAALALGWVFASWFPRYGAPPAPTSWWPAIAAGLSVIGLQGLVATRLRAIAAGRLANVALWQLARWRWMGQAVAFLTPGPQIGGEAVEIYMLGRDTPVTPAEAAGLLALDRTLGAVTRWTLLLILILSSLGAGPGRTSKTESLLWAGLVFAPLCGGGLMLLIAWQRQHRPFTWLAQLTQGSQYWPWLASAASWLRAMEDTATRSAGQVTSPRTLILSTAAACWEVLDFGLFWLWAFGLENPSAITISAPVLAFVAARVAFLTPAPMGLGVFEISQIMVAQGLGLPVENALLLCVLVRCRDASVLALGLIGFSGVGGVGRWAQDRGKQIREPPSNVGRRKP